MNPALAAWGAEVLIITVRDFATDHRPPLPSEFLATFVVFGALAALGGTENGRRPAAAIAWGLVVATALASKVDFLAPVGRFMAPAPSPSKGGTTNG